MREAAAATASMNEGVVVETNAKKTKKVKPSIGASDTALKNELLAQFDPSSFTCYKPPTPQFWGAV